MSKKRVHEIAKELKSHGIELDNKEVVTELVALGYDVKSHSSSLEDDQATAAIQKIVDKKKPSKPVAPVAAKGFVVRRKAGDHHGAAEASAAATRPPEPQPAQELEAETEAAAAVEAPVTEAPAAPEQPVAAEAQPAEPAPVQAPAPAAEEQPAAAAATAAETAPEAAPTPSQPAQPIAAQPGQPPVARPGTATVVSRPGMHVRPGMQQGGRPPTAPQTYQRSTGATVTIRPGAGTGSAVVRPGQERSNAQASASPTPQPTAPGVDPRTLRPTATQAVVISRPLIQVRRVTPSSTAHRNIPMAPGRKAIGEVREFKVVPDHLGRGREFVDISKKKEQAGAGRGKKTTEKEGAYKQEITDVLWGRYTIPVRGKKKKPTKKGAKTQITEMAEEKKVIKLESGISVSDLAQRMGVKTAEIIKKLMTGGTMATANQIIDPDTAEIIATDYGWRIEKVGFEVEDYLPEVEENEADFAPRPPVVTVMGHVDHGKTSLLDAIRQADVATGEAGGITQHIGSYTVKTNEGDITFLDTPGHEAFTAMRARGANVTDIAVLVVAADDSVMPQTIESIKHAKAAEVPIVVAINKIDKESANPDRVKKDLSNYELLPEEWGGETIMVPVSAHTKEGIDRLLESIVLQAEVLELKANPSRPAVGAIIEAKLEKGRGPVATVLVQEGTLRVGDAIVTGTHYGKVRAMSDGWGDKVEELKPGYSAEVIGLSGVPTAGDTLNAVEDERAAKEIAEHRETRARQAEVGKTAKESLEALFAKAKAGEQKELRVILKADVQGSVEAVATAVNKLATPKVKVEIVDKGVGMMTESDVMRAAASKAVVIGFNSRPESGAEAAAKKLEVRLETFSIIYELIDSVRTMMEGLLEPIRTEKRLGRAEVRNLFNVPKLGTIAGSAVIEGTIKRSALVRLWRENKQVYSGKLASLKRFKDDVKEVAQGYECGIGIENFADLKPGDIIEAYEIEETRPSLS